MNNLFKRLGVLLFSTPIILILFFCKTANAYTPVHQSYTSGKYYNDGTYEYAIGLSCIMDNSVNGKNALSAPKPKTGLYSQPGDHVSIDVFRDMWINTSGYGKLPFAGWTYYDCVWSSRSVLNKYGNNVNWYNQYVSNINTLAYNKFKEEGIQDGGSKIYTNGNGIYNRYRRFVIVIFKRPLPKAYLGNSYIANDGSKVYANGSDLWKKSGKIEFRTWGYDYYDTNNQNVQYTGGLRGVYLGIASNNKNFLIKTDRNQSTTFSEAQISNGNSPINYKPFTYSYSNVNRYTSDQMTTVSMSGSKKT